MASGPKEIFFSLSGASGKVIDHAVFDYGDSSVQAPRPWKRGRPKGARTKSHSRRPIMKEAKKQPNFEFINFSQNSRTLDEASKVKIRRQARASKGHYQSDEKNSRSNIQSEDVDPFGQTPVEFEPYMHDLLRDFSSKIWKKFYSLEDLAGCNPVTEYWLPLAFQDPGLLHSIIACAEVYTSGYRTIQNRARGFKHLIITINIVNERLKSGEKMHSIGTLAIIAGISLLEKGAGRHDHWRIHMQGLKQLLQMHGGLETLHSEPMILNKIYRADLYGSLDAAQTPFFDRPLPYSETLVIEPLSSVGFNEILEMHSIDNKLSSCLRRLEVAQAFWSDYPKPSPEDAAQIRYILTDVQYVLVSPNLSPSFETGADQVNELLRIALILFTLTILNERPPSTAVGQRVTETFKRSLVGLGLVPNAVALNSPEMLGEHPLPVDFCLWVCFMALDVTKNIESDTKIWLLSLMFSLLSFRYGRYIDWVDLESCLSRYLWVPKIHVSGLQWLRCRVREE